MDLRADDPWVLDGGLATELERRGHDLRGALWSARLLVDDPEAVVAAHAAFFAAGAQVATTASYQASEEGFARVGVDADRARALLRTSVSLARRACDEAAPAARRLVAASVGPYGATLADGSEYTGAYDLGFAALRAFHRRRLDVLVEAGPDLLAAETLPSLTEVEALLGELDRLDVPAWVSLSVAGDRTRRGEPAAEAFAMARDVACVVAVGVNCCDPRDLADVVALAAAASGKPVVVYPNSGERWDAVGRRWTGAAGFDADAVRSWVAAGAAAVGGCCRVGPAQISEVERAVRAVRDGSAGGGSA